tara:strand:+ start:850 stop:1095 length:246 start_codon:yes stop_codon:yes gene_type:complete
MTVKKLINRLKLCNPNDHVFIQTIDLDTGDEIDLYPFYIDEVGVTHIHSEIRLVQQNNDTPEAFLDEIFEGTNDQLDSLKI